MKELETNSNNKHILDFYRVMSWFNTDYRTTASLVKDESDILLQDFPNNLNSKNINSVSCVMNMR
jgi:hypothetical protein